MNRETWTRSEPRTTHLETFISNSYIYLGNQVKETPKLGLKLKIVARTLRSAHFWIGPKYAGSDRVEDATWIFIAIVKITKNSLHQDEVFSLTTAERRKYLCYRQKNWAPANEAVLSHWANSSWEKTPAFEHPAFKIGHSPLNIAH